MINARLCNLQRASVSLSVLFARLGKVSRARMTKIMNMVNLAPDIKEASLFLPRVQRGQDPMMELERRIVVREEVPLVPVNVLPNAWRA